MQGVESISDGGAKEANEGSEMTQWLPIVGDQ